MLLFNLSSYVVVVVIFFTPNYHLLCLTTDQPAEGILLIKPDWDKYVDDASGYVSMKQDSDGQTVTSGDTEGH